MRDANENSNDLMTLYDLKIGRKEREEDNLFKFQVSGIK